MNKPLLAITSGAGVFALSLIACILGLTEALGQSAKTSHEEWMGALPDTAKIADTPILGTHNTLALYGIGDLSGQCQSLPIEQQLKIGVRFLDIRLQESGGNLRAVHSFIDEKKSFKDTLAKMEEFLQAHPKETLFVSIKNETGSSPENFEKLLQKHYEGDPFWFLERSMPETLGQVRGKIVLISRYSPSTVGIEADSGWRDSATFQMGDFLIQDEYKIDDIAKKKSSISACYAATAKYKINFLSGCFNDGFPPSYAPSVAKEINRWFTANIDTFDLKGFTLVDFVTSEIADAFYGAKK